MPANSTLTGTFRMHRNVPSRFFPRTRDVYVYLPPGYAAQRRRRFPVLYFNDAQNLFDGATSFVPGQEWQLDESAQRLILEGAIAPLIIVGVNHAGEHRLEEFTPTRDLRKNVGGSADLYGRMLIEEIKPRIDATYRTLPTADATGLGGSSLGGLVAMHVGATRPDVFGRLAVMSPSVWWGRRAVVRTVASLGAKAAQRIWLDIGTAEGQSTIRDARALKAALVRKGWRVGGDLAYTEVEGAPHSEAAWAARVPDVLRYLYPPA